MKNKLVILAVGVVTLTLFCGAGLLAYSRLVRPRIESINRQRQLRARTRAVLVSLLNRPPQNVSTADWRDSIGMTITAHANCFLDDPRLDLVEYERFVDELENRSNGAITLDLIDWVWDEIERIGVNGTSYSADYRPTRNGRIRSPDR
jgi:hypothetical protein